MNPKKLWNDRWAKSYKIKNSGKQKRGRKSLKQIGLTQEEILLRRQLQNKLSQRKSRERKKHNYNGKKFFIISEPQLVLLQSLLEKISANNFTGSAEEHMNFAIGILKNLPNYIN